MSKSFIESQLIRTIKCDNTRKSLHISVYHIKLMSIFLYVRAQLKYQSTDFSTVFTNE